MLYPPALVNVENPLFLGGYLLYSIKYFRSSNYLYLELEFHELLRLALKISSWETFGTLTKGEHYYFHLLLFVFELSQKIMDHALI